MSLQVNIAEEKPGVKRVHISGRLDTSTAPQLEEAVTPAVAGSQMLIFDLAELEYISSAGLRVVFKATKGIQQNGGRAGVMNMQPQIQKVFDIVKAMPDVPIFKNDDEMDEYLSAMQQKILDGDS